MKSCHRFNNYVLEKTSDQLPISTAFHRSNFFSKKHLQLPVHMSSLCYTLKTPPWVRSTYSYTGEIQKIFTKKTNLSQLLYIRGGREWSSLRYNTEQKCNFRYPGVPSGTPLCYRWLLWTSSQNLHTHARTTNTVQLAQAGEKSLVWKFFYVN